MWPALLKKTRVAAKPNSGFSKYAQNALTAAIGHCILLTNGIVPALAKAGSLRVERRTSAGPA
jgi:hypothetical protein